MNRICLLSILLAACADAPPTETDPARGSIQYEPDYDAFSEDMGLTGDPEEDYDRLFGEDREPTSLGAVPGDAEAERGEACGNDPATYTETRTGTFSSTLQGMHTRFWVPESYTPDRSYACLLYTSPSPRDLSTSRMPSSA